MLADFLKELKKLPYSDMMQVARVLHERMDGVYSVNKIADDLATVAQMPVADSSSTQVDTKIVRKLFGRKRSISLRMDGSGFKASIPTLQVSTSHTDLRTALTHLIDIAVTAEAMKSGS
jgi:hypothetical protein